MPLLAKSPVPIAALIVLAVSAGCLPDRDRNPYLQRVSETQATVAWFSVGETSGQVRFGRSPTKLDTALDASEPGERHELTITGLSPATRYYYSVGPAGGAPETGDEEHYFETAPPRGTKKKLRAWVVGDSGTGDENQAAVRDAMREFIGPDRLDLFIHVGDMAYEFGWESQFSHYFFAPYQGILTNTPVWPAMGNHEGITSDSFTQSGPYYEAFVLPTRGECGGAASGTEAYYAFDYANVHFVVLDSNESPRAPEGAMLKWLRQDLEMAKADWLVAYWHHPPYSKGSHDSDEDEELVEMRENALPILEAAGVDLVLGGHSHIYERSFLLDGAYDTPTTRRGHVVDEGDGGVLGDGAYLKRAGLVPHEGAVYVVAGHGGTGTSQAGRHPVMLRTELENGSVILDVHDNRLAATNVRFDGKVTDRFSIVKGPALVLGAPDGGERLEPGSLVPIEWRTLIDGEPQPVTLEYSVDGGTSWMLIAEAVRDVERHDWTVPETDTSHGLVRVRRADGFADESNGTFRIGGYSRSELEPETDRAPVAP